MEPNIYKPNIYKTPTVYKSAGGGGGGLPDDVILFNSLENLNAVSGNGLTIEFNQTNENIEFIFDYEIKSFSGSNIWLINKNPVSAYAPFIQLNNAYDTTYLSNASNNSNTMYSAAHTLNYRYTRSMKNGVYKNYFGGNLKTGIPYGVFTIPKLDFISFVQGLIKIYCIAIKKDDDFIYKLKPAKKLNDVGMFDEINNVFYTMDSGNWSVLGQII